MPPHQQSQARNSSRRIAMGRVGVAALLTLGLGFGTVASAEEKAFDKTLTVTSGGTLIVDTDTGSINIAGTDASEVTINVKMRGNRNQLDDFHLTADAANNQVNVRGRRDMPQWLAWITNGPFDVQYTIQVPREFHVQARTAGGNLELRNLSGKTVARTSGGNVRINGLSGDADVRTSGGSIRALQIVGNTKLITSGGNIDVENAHGDVSARTSGGDIRLKEIDSKLVAHTSGGDVDVFMVGANRGVDVSTSGGDITLHVPTDFKAAVSARTSGGDVDCDLPVESIEKFKHSRLEGKINGGGEPLVAKTSGGDITIRLAAK
ncbi:MAG TPA: DUF4097 family beta strand repeat-containing protein [Steroidobacteraceae bacterium]|nr:DUF4097 family beta strand repeat-containing protein [Steroidobacteraceae bacterium]